MSRLRRSGSALKRSLDDLLSVLLPPACLVCDELRHRRGEAGVCARCWASVAYLTGPACPRCGHPHPDLEDDDLEGLLCGACLGREPPFQAGLSLAAYTGPMKAMVRLLKFSERANLARPLAARAAAFLRGRAPLVGPVDRIVPVPLPLLRRLRRGYNQSTLLARELGRRLGIPVDAGALGRRWRGRPQAGLPSRRRAGNVRGAFRVRRPGSVAGCRLLVVDDVWTTGATLAECSRALRGAGARRVTVFSLARTPPAGGSQGAENL